MLDAYQRLTAALSRSYRLERELGQGGMATVYLAEDLKHRRKVAVKVLRPELAATMGSERFAREIEVYAAAHGWCPPDSAVYDEKLAEKAWSRLLALFKTALA